ncbi:MAG: tannase/feruloyl esterase family alpha/beta hydrolase, partial [Bacteroidales bacterium]|nr:tannase/feruloyl esterase family alpha/beta hydrolase [Bacteroidales bacterium]
MKKTFFLLLILPLSIIVASSQGTPDQPVIITKADIEKAGTSIPVQSIGEPVSSVKLYPPRWIEAAGD